MALLITDPIDIKLGDDGDIEIVDGKLQWSSGLQGVVQGIRIRLQMFRGEWFLNLDAGVPWLERDDGSVPAEQAILGQRFNEPKARRAVRTAILATPGVLGVLGLEVSFTSTTRKLTIRWEARTVFGDTDPDTLEV